MEMDHIARQHRLAPTVFGMTKLKMLPCGTVGHRPQPTAMSFDDRVADRQSQAHAVALGREKGIKDAVDICFIESLARVLDCNLHVAMFVELVLIRSFR